MDLSNKTDKQKKTEEDKLVKQSKDNSRLTGAVKGLANHGYVKAGAFDDGYQFGDVTKTVGSTILSGFNSIGRGVIGTVEGITDAANYGLAEVDEILGLKDLAKERRNFAKQNLTDKITMSSSESFLGKNSVLGEKSDSIAESIGGVLLNTALGGVASTTKGATAITNSSMFASSYGQGVSEAYENGATDEEAQKYGLISGTAETLTEMMFGGLGKGSKAVGFSKGAIPVDDMLAKSISSKFKSQLAKNLTEYGIKATGEGIEEVASGLIQGIGKKLTFKSDEELSKILSDEQLLDQFIGGAVASGIMQTPSLVKTTKQNRDFVSGYTDNEQTVLDNVTDVRYNEALKENTDMSEKEKTKLHSEIEEKAKKDLEEGNLTADELTNALGNTDYTNYQKANNRINELETQIKELQNKSTNDMSLSEYNSTQSQIKELQKELKSIDTKALQEKLNTPLENRINENDTLLKNSYANYYNNEAQKNVKFEYQPQTDKKGNEIKLDDYSKNVYESAKIMNNTKQSHELADFVAKISKDTNVYYEFTNTEDLKAKGYNVADKVINGLNTEDGKILINIDSDSAIYQVVGHETTHLFENTEDYKTLQNEVFEYAKMKGTYDTKRAEIESNYKGIKANIDNELTSDLIGEYLSNDSKFIENLSKNKNIFEKIYDKIKHIYSMATAGSKEQRQLEKVKRSFEKVYQKKANISKENKYSVNNKETIDYAKYKSSSFDEDYKKFENGNYTANDTLTILDETPDYFYNLGYDTDNKIVINMKKLNAIMQEKKINHDGLNQHGITKDIIEQLPYAISNPLNVIKNPNYKNRLVVVTELSDKYGDIIIVPIEINTNGNQNRVVSIYGKENYDDNDKQNVNGYMEQNKSNIVYDIDNDVQKKSRSLDAPIALRNNSSENNVPQSNKNVKSGTTKSVK